ncbi:MAG: hypothetical protein ACR2GA_04410 [Chloroflexota bacterium]
MAGLTRDEYDVAAKEIQKAWSGAQTRDAGLQVIIEYGRKYGYKNVIAAIQNRLPKQFSREMSVEEFQSMSE